MRHAWAVAGAGDRAEFFWVQYARTRGRGSVMVEKSKDYVAAAAQLIGLPAPVDHACVTCLPNAMGADFGDRPPSNLAARPSITEATLSFPRLPGWPDHDALRSAR